MTLQWLCQQELSSSSANPDKLHTWVTADRGAELHPACSARKNTALPSKPLFGACLKGRWCPAVVEVPGCSSQLLGFSPGAWPKPSLDSNCFVLLQFPPVFQGYILDIYVSSFTLYSLRVSSSSWTLQTAHHDQMRDLGHLFLPPVPLYLSPQLLLLILDAVPYFSWLSSDDPSTRERGKNS